MTDVEHIIHNLADNDHQIKALEEAGTLLREESWRTDPRMTEVVRISLPLASKEDVHTLNVLRLLINFTADNDANRRFLTGEESPLKEFWASVDKKLNNSDPESVPEIASRITLLLTQFTRNISEGDEANFKSFLVSFVPSLLLYLDQLEKTEESDDMANALEVLNEIPVNVLGKTIPDKEKSISTLYSILKKLVKLFEEDPEESECLLQASQLLCSLTSADIIEGLDHDVHELLSLLHHINQETQDLTRAKRFIFATAGNIFSGPDHDNWLSMDGSLQILLNPQTDPYAVAAAAIDLGNCVKSHADQGSLIAKINHHSSIGEVISSLLQRKYTDVVQYQFLHFFNNTLNTTNSNLFFDGTNYTYLLPLSKVVIDNAKFYQEIFKIFKKFVIKLVTLSFTEDDLDPAPFNDLWVLLLEGENSINEVSSLLLQAQAQRKRSLKNDAYKSLLLNLVKHEEKVEATAILGKLKALAVLLDNYNYPAFAEEIGAETVERFQLGLTTLLHNLNENSKNTDDAQQNNKEASILKNNLLFVAASAKKFFPDSTEISRTSDGIIAEHLGAHSAQIGY